MNCHICHTPIKPGDRIAQIILGEASSVYTDDVDIIEPVVETNHFDCWAEPEE